MLVDHGKVLVLSRKETKNDQYEAWAPCLLQLGPLGSKQFWPVLICSESSSRIVNNVVTRVVYLET